jgi:alkylhydroperoxidase family enzyme
MWRESPLFDEQERLVLELADAMCATPAVVSDDLYARFRAAFDPAQQVEIASMIAWENYRSRWNRVFDVEAQGFAEGAVCAMPVRRAIAP